jgi:hypothetical protein
VSAGEEAETIGDTSRVAMNPPITALLSWVWIAHTIEVDNSFESLRLRPNACWQTRQVPLPWQPMVLHRGGWPDAS